MNKVIEERYNHIKSLEPTVPRILNGLDQIVLRTGNELINGETPTLCEYSKILSDSAQNDTHKHFYIVQRNCDHGKFFPSKKLYDSLYDAIGKAMEKAKSFLDAYRNYTLEDYNDIKLKLVRGEAVKICENYSLQIRYIDWS